MTVILFLAALILTAYLVNRFTKAPIDTVSDGKHYTLPVKFSTQEFYTLAADLIKEEEIPDVKLSRVHHSMKGLLSAKREYLRVVYHEYFFDICAAPFAKEFFVSWRQGTLEQFVKVGKRKNKTFYEEDTELMFKAAIRHCVDRAIDQISEENGTRLPNVQLVRPVQPSLDNSVPSLDGNSLPLVNEGYAADV